MQRASRIAEEFLDNESYRALPLCIDELEKFDEERDGCVIVGAVDEQRLQQRNEQCRLMGKDIYQLADGHFFEDSFGVPMTV